MRFHDRSSDPQSHARPVSLGGKERIEDFVCPLRWEPPAGIADRDQHPTAKLGHFDMRCHAGQQFPGCKGLDEIVVGAGLQSLHA